MRIATGAVLLATFAFGQARPAARVPTQSTDRVKALAGQVLDSAAAQALGFQPPMRAAVQFLIGKTYQHTNPAKAKNYFIAAYDTVKYLQDRDVWGIATLKEEVVGSTAAVAPQHVEQALPGEPRLRDVALQRLVSYYVAAGQVGHAANLVEQMSTEPEVDVAAREVMIALGPKGNVERARIFAMALRVYQQNSHPYITAGFPEDLGTLVVRFWRDLPPALVHEAIEELLKQAKPENAPEDSQVRKAGMTASASAGTLTFASLYEFRLFQLLPILRHIDAEEGDQLTASIPQLRSAFAMYPQGQESLDPTLRDSLVKPDEVPSATYAITPQGSGMVQLAISSETSRHISTIINTAADDPQMSLARAGAITDPSLRIGALIGIARAVLKKNQEVARAALQQAMNDMPSLRPEVRWKPALDAGDLWLALNDASRAADAVNVASNSARAIYAQDANPDDPNSALKLYWPSAMAWRDALTLAQKVSPELALDVLKDMPDPEIRAAEDVFLAGLWLNVQPWSDTSPLVGHRRNHL